MNAAGTTLLGQCKVKKKKERKRKKSRNNAARKQCFINSEMFYGLALERDLAAGCTRREKSVYVWHGEQEDVGEAL